MDSNYNSDQNKYPYEDKWKQGTVTDYDNGKISLDFLELGLKELSFKSYYNLKNVTCLKLGFNDLSSLEEEVFTNFKALEWVDLRNNQLETIPSTVAHHPTLKTLLLAHNKIKRLPIELGSVPNLTGLQVSFNPLEFPPMEVFHQGQNMLIEFMQNAWKQSHPQNNEESSETEKGEGDAKKEEETEEEEESNEERTVTLKGMELNIFDHMWLTKVQECLDSQMAELQRMKDAEALKQWREKYSFYASLSSSLSDKKPKDPPFGTDEENRKMLSRKDLLKPLTENSKPVPSLDSYKRTCQYLEDKLKDARQKLSEINFSSPCNDSSSALVAIKQIKEVQKSLEELKRRNS